MDDKEKRENLAMIRHSTSHIMAQAVKRLYQDVKLAIGPSIENGFYYDLDLPEKITEKDLKNIENEMLKIVKEKASFEKSEMPKDKALQFFRDKGEIYKVELIEGLEGDSVSLYQNSEFIDLCKGPHVENTSQVRFFKLLSVAGAYWRGSEKNKMLQRIYGTAFESKEELKTYIKNLAEAEKRDHRRLGKELDLFSINEKWGSGLVLWHPNGAMIRYSIESFLMKELFKRGYQNLYTPHIANLNLWKQSGHWDFYRENMYSPVKIDETEYMIKPMNCPGHILIYKSKVRSYRELPLRWAELGTVYRYERSGVLHGMMRVRGFTQDDAHIFCTPDQVREEVVAILDLIDFMMTTFHFKYKIFISTRPEKSVGSDEVWDRAQKALIEAVESRNISYEIEEGEGVFYGPKIDIKLIDAMDRGWQGPTIQVDFNIPERFDVNFINKEGREERVVMIHRTVLGSMERFMGILIEHYGGYFPLWLQPVQVMIIPVSKDFDDYARKVMSCLLEEDVRVECDTRDESLSKKIKGAEKRKIRYMLIVGEKEKETDSVSLRVHKAGNQGQMSTKDFVIRVKDEIQKKD